MKVNTGSRMKPNSFRPIPEPRSASPESPSTSAPAATTSISTAELPMLLIPCRQPTPTSSSLPSSPSPNAASSSAPFACGQPSSRCAIQHCPNPDNGCVNFRPALLVANQGVGEQGRVGLGGHRSHPAKFEDRFLRNWRYRLLDLEVLTKVDSLQAYPALSPKCPRFLPHFWGISPTQGQYFHTHHQRLVRCVPLIVRYLEKWSQACSRTATYPSAGGYRAAGDHRDNSGNHMSGCSICIENERLLRQAALEHWAAVRRYRAALEYSNDLSAAEKAMHAAQAKLNQAEASCRHHLDLMHEVNTTAVTNFSRVSRQCQAAGK